MAHWLRPAVRAVGVLAVCAGTVGAAWWLSVDLLRPVLTPLVGQSAIDGVSFAQALDATCAAVLLSCVSWLALGAALTVASYAAGVLSGSGPTTAVLEALAERGCPRRLRRLVLACLGVAIGAGATAPAMAHPQARAGITDRPGAHGTAVADGVRGLVLPDRTTGAASPARHDAPSAATTPADPTAHTVLVRPGDSLWTITAELLPAGASDRAVTTAWHRLHRANASVIGADPDLIHPGTHLGVPDRLTREREDRR